MSRPRDEPWTAAAASTALHVDIRVLAHGLGVPTRASDGDAGVDLCATVAAVIEPGARVLVGTGIAIVLPSGHVGLVHPRSGLAARRGLGVLNAPGTVDAGYRGEIMVCLINHDREHAVEILRGDRVAQLLVQRVETVHFRVVPELAASVRGDRGHGSSGGHRSLEEARSVPGAQPRSVFGERGGS